MIPRSINKRRTNSVADDWEVKDDVIPSANTENDSGGEEDEEEEEESFREKDYQYLRESVNKLCEEQIENSSVNVEKDLK